MTLYLPVETAARELDAKLLVALLAAERGIDVVLGNRARLANRLHRFAPGVFLAHNFDRKRRRLLSIARDLGHRVVAWDEEGLVWISPEVYRRRRADPRALSCVEVAYAWGEQHAQALSPAAERSGCQVVVAGNPRADLLRPELRPLAAARAAAIAAELGPFVLLNSNFGWLNHAVATEAMKGEDEAALQAIAARSRHPVEFLAFRLAVFRAMTAALPALARADARRKIVIRPHPSESSAAWERAAAGLDNVIVRRDDELVPWLLAADAIVQNGCTTALEAALLGRRPISFRPIDGGAFEIPQPLEVSIEARTVEELIESVAASAAATESQEALAARIGHLVTAMTGPLAAERIVDDLLRFEAVEVGPRWRRVRGGLRSRLRSAEHGLRRRLVGSASRTDYVDQKFPPMPIERVTARLAELAQLLNRPLPAVTEVDDRIWRIALGAPPKAR